MNPQLAYSVLFPALCNLTSKHVLQHPILELCPSLRSVQNCARVYVTTPSSETLRLNALSLFSPFFEGPSSTPIRNCRQNL